ncbi:ATP binding protein domain 4 [Strigomonas culicis]|uniref:Diphthine--ammonia ligase n=1 Tax=Strigomonas culicis TaxID=28005 RepID=S9VVE8_9TRYP|nr:ATP binding protein domain 4 [Strigomonas culicis]EPY26267.1 ATP binding protein domain 4 [Strigomonas culicis]EPY27290.1 ATP binding protein domain 4 [Strigomonas culicis]|eukprot:EPY23479.1 ATP binding protein domain 4 [Strigomonas culicis]
MKTIALISGGKDSLLAILAAYRYGHEPVVLVHLTPAAVGGADAAAATSDASSSMEMEQELDSYMFQTVGSNVVGEIAHCLDLPLRMGFIEKGQSKDVSLAYSTSPDSLDEVEVLYRLLKAVKEEFPDVQGVTTGAILSNYQRLRVEAVCFRLGLLSLSYLWMRQPAEILDMAKELRLTAILVKTASIGLDPRILIGQTLEEARPRLEAMARQYGSHLAGEGGEYETTVLNFPMFKREYLTVISKRIVVVDDNPFAPSGHGIFTVARRPKGDEEMNDDAVLLKQLRDGKTICFPSDVMSPLLLPGASPLSTPAPSSAECWVKRCRTCALPDLGSSLGLEQFVAHEEAEALDETATPDAAVRGMLDRWHAFACPGSTRPFFFLFLAPTNSYCEAFDRAYEDSMRWIEPPGRLSVVDPHSLSGNRAQLHVYYSNQHRGAPTECDNDAKVTVLHCQSRSHWAAGVFGPVAEGTLYHTASRSVCFVGPAYGLVPALGTLAVETALDSIPLQYEASASDFEAELCFAFANLMAYLSFFKLSPASVTHLTCVTTPEAPSDFVGRNGTPSSFYFRLFEKATVWIGHHPVWTLPFSAHVALLAVCDI